MTAIGIFDSGLWWLQTLQYFKQFMPDYDYVFLADTANKPYGDKSGEQIKELTFSSLRYLFDVCKVQMVILACNTAAAYAVRDWQAMYPENKVLSVTIPWVEAMIEGNYKHIGVLMTQASMQSGVYPYLFGRFGGVWSSLSLVAAPTIVPAIESWLMDSEERKKILAPYMSKFDANVDCIVLGCTHYPLWKDEIQSFFPVPVIDPGEESAKKLVWYLQRHPEITDKLSRDGHVDFLVTWDPEQFAKVWSHIWWGEMKVKKVVVGE